MSPLIQVAIVSSLGISIGQVLYDRLRKEPREWGETARSIWDSVTAIAMFTAIVILYLQPSFK
jgi:hypothetical protein